MAIERLFTVCKGGPRNRRLDQETGNKAVRILFQEVYRGFGSTLVGEYLQNKHGIQIGRERLRRLMIPAHLWRGRRRKAEAVHQGVHDAVAAAKWCTASR